MQHSPALLLQEIILKLLLCELLELAARFRGCVGTGEQVHPLTKMQHNSSIQAESRAQNHMCQAARSGCRVRGRTRTTSRSRCRRQAGETRGAGRQERQCGRDAVRLHEALVILASPG